MNQTIARPQRGVLYKVQRFGRRYREVIMIVLTLLMSIAFLLFGFYMAVRLESAHPQWFGNGY